MGTTDQLYDAINAKKTAQVVAALDEGADPNGIRDDRRVQVSPLGLAVRKGHGPTVRTLLERGADANLFARGSCPLFVAVAKPSKGRLKILQLLLDHGADANVCHPIASAEVTALNYALSHFGTATVEVVRMLLAAGADANARSDGGPDFGPINYPLWLAAIGGHAEIVSMLVEAGAKADFGFRHLRPNHNPLSAAVEGGHPSIAELLVDAGAPLDPRRLSPECCEWLLETYQASQIELRAPVSETTIPVPLAHETWASRRHKISVRMQRAVRVADSRV